MVNDGGGGGDGMESCSSTFYFLLLRLLYLKLLFLADYNGHCLSLCHFIFAFGLKKYCPEDILTWLYYRCS